MHSLAVTRRAAACYVWAGRTNPIANGEEIILKLKAGVKQRLDDLGARVKNETVFEPATRERSGRE